MDFQPTIVCVCLPLEHVLCVDHKIHNYRWDYLIKSHHSHIYFCANFSGIQNVCVCVCASASTPFDVFIQCFTFVSRHLVGGLCRWTAATRAQTQYRFVCTYVREQLKYRRQIEINAFSAFEMSRACIDENVSAITLAFVQANNKPKIIVSRFKRVKSFSFQQD